MTQARLQSTPLDAQARGRRTEQPDLRTQLVIAEAALGAPNGGSASAFAVRRLLPPVSGALGISHKYALPASPANARICR